MSYEITVLAEVAGSEKNPVLQGTVELGEKTLTKPVVNVWWDAPGGEQEYQLKDVGAWVEVVEEAGMPFIHVTWIDPTDRNLRKSGPADVKQTAAVPMPPDGPGGGGIGPFVVVANEVTA